MCSNDSFSPRDLLDEYEKHYEVPVIADEACPKDEAYVVDLANVDLDPDQTDEEASAFGPLRVVGIRNGRQVEFTGPIVAETR